jgi:hypothetical protein
MKKKRNQKNVDPTALEKKDTCSDAPKIIESGF